MTETPADSFRKIVLANVDEFSRAVGKMLQAMFAADCPPGAASLVDEGLETPRNFFVSILFTGMVYGEYILAMDERTAAAIAGVPLEAGKDGETAARRDVSDAFRELLNLAVGESVVSLVRAFQKLTITPPRVCFGKMNYPKVTTGKATLVAEAGPIECYLYVDRMKLDLAASYREAMSSVLAAHRELQKAMKELQAQQTRLVQSEKLAALGTLAAGVAHEINTPLATVSVVGGRMKHLLKAPGEIDRAALGGMLDTVETTVRRISEITGRMRIYAAQSRGGRAASVSARAIVEDALMACDRAFEKRGIEFRYAPPPETLTIECRALEIAQAVHALLDNACDAAQAASGKWVGLEVKDLGDSVEFSVTDPGAGIPAEARERIFDPFFTTKEVGQGAGLGLSVAKGLIDRHGGQLGLDPASPHTRFFLRLPKVGVREAAA